MRFFVSIIAAGCLAVAVHAVDRVPTDSTDGWSEAPPADGTFKPFTEVGLGAGFRLDDTKSLDTSPYYVFSVYRHITPSLALAAKLSYNHGTTAIDRWSGDEGPTSYDITWGAGIRIQQPEHLTAVVFFEAIPELRYYFTTDGRLQATKLGLDIGLGGRLRISRLVSIDGTVRHVLQKQDDSRYVPIDPGSTAELEYIPTIFFNPTVVQFALKVKL